MPKRNEVVCTCPPYVRRCEPECPTIRKVKVRKSKKFPLNPAKIDRQETIERNKLIRTWSPRGLLPVNVQEKKVLQILLDHAIEIIEPATEKNRAKLKTLLYKVNALWTVPARSFKPITDDR